MTNTITKRGIKKAQSSSCRYKICAIALDKYGNVMGYTSNAPRFPRLGGSIHAEMKLMSRYGKNIYTIIILRTNKTGSNILPIHPCKICSKKAQELGIKIVSVEPD